MEQKLTRSELTVVKEAWTELTVAVAQMSPKDDRVICDHVKRAEGMLRALVLIRTVRTEGNQNDK